MRTLPALFSANRTSPRFSTPLFSLLSPMLEDDFFSPHSFGSFPKIDVQEKENSYLVTADIPNMDKKDVSISFQDGVLTISGTRTEETGSEDSEKYLVRERAMQTQSFSRSLQLPKYVNESNVKAKMENGILEVELPISENKKSNVITID